MHTSNDISHNVNVDFYHFFRIRKVKYLGKTSAAKWFAGTKPTAEKS